MKNEKEILNQLMASISEMKEDAIAQAMEAVEEANEAAEDFQRGRFMALAEIEAYLKAIGASN
jgi:hypothetical protein